jgi:hypothetical protein
MTPHVPVRRRFVTRLSLVLLLLAAWASPLAGMAQEAPLEVYRSPEFGYLFWFDPREWTVEDTERGTGSDWVQLGNGQTAVGLWGTSTPGATPASCLADRLAEIESDADLVRFQSLAEPGARPEVTESYNGFSVWSEMILGFAGPDGRETFAVRERCAALDPSGGMLLISEWTTADAYNARASLKPTPLNAFDTAGVLATLTLARPAWTFSPDRDWGEGPPFGGPTRLLAPDGSEAALITTHTFACEFTPPISSALAGTAIVIENTGAADLSVAPEHFAAVDLAGNDLGPVPLRWIWPDIDAAQTAVIPPGDVAIAQLPDGNGGGFYLFDPWDNWILLTTDIGCQGGGAAPVLIDLEE